MHTKIYWLSTEDPEWNAAWSAFPDPELYNEQYGERLQYMGTVARCTEADGWPSGATIYVHEFRHRALPGSNQRWYAAVPATRGWRPRDVAMEQHLVRLGA